ncbi:uncharacterized protein EHS24_002074 [Apiotrichum porosum]|uniref:Transmembrane protein 188 n=1 Tax=Apiotrichum porosum TaxID=105984 RepID=A0A427XHJ6_9TREE|nr:uncharacterized protein EHS24_002074 [Apiotrichum porosum]RSH78351.1 hypothetical protein EHS24_002074 [Apiotrichum porosum]
MSARPATPPAGGHSRSSSSGSIHASGSSTPLPRRPAPTAPYNPAPDTSTYRDLLLFEERLKMNAEMLRRRRRRYSGRIPGTEGASHGVAMSLVPAADADAAAKVWLIVLTRPVFLYSFIVALVVMAYRLVVMPPENLVLLRGLQAAVAVVFITLALFFASGMHEEKIRYAHAYVNHSNKALRPLNMYFNVRRPRSSLLSYLPLPSALKPAPAPLKAQVVPGKRPGTTPRRVSTSSSASAHAGSHTVMAQIPPSTNPRGELIFSSRVDHHFEDGYKRYRAAFERRREERAREEARARRPWWLPSWGRRASTPPPPQRVERLGSASSAAASPALSRRSTPEPGSRGIPSPPASPRTSSMRGARTPSPGAPTPESRARAESYSFVYTGPGEAVSARAGK